MSSLCPPQYVEFPAVQPYRQGLFTVAAFPPTPDRLACGVEFQPWSCEQAWTLADPGCPADPFTLIENQGMSPFKEAAAFHVYAPFSCSAIGLQNGEAEERASIALQQGEQRAVEYAFWTGLDTTTGAEDQRVERLAHPSAVALGTGLSPEAGLAALEGFLGENYGGVGTIHAPRELSVYFPLPDFSQDRPTTRLGTRIAFGGGYSEANTSPVGVAAAAGTYWAYATGQVAIWRGPAEIWPPSPNAVFDKETNMVSLLAARQYAIATDCILGAVSITP